MRDRPRRSGPADRPVDFSGDGAPPPRAEGRAGVDGRAGLDGRAGRPAGLRDRDWAARPERPATSADSAQESRPPRRGGRKWLDKLPETRLRAPRPLPPGGPRPDAGRERGWRPSAVERDHGGRQEADTSPGRRAGDVGPARRPKEARRERRPDSDGPRPRDLQAFAKQRDSRVQGRSGPNGPDRREPYRPWFYSEERAEPWFLNDPDR